jgi:mRNA interferase MazF
MVEVKRGDVVLCDLNPVIGTEQSGIRPAVIIQIDKANIIDYIMTPTHFIRHCLMNWKSSAKKSHIS